MTSKSMLSLHAQRLLSGRLSAPALQLVAAKLKPGTDAVGPSGTLATTYSLAESRTDTEAGGDLLTKGDSRSRFLKWVTSQISTSDSQNEEAAAGKQRYAHEMDLPGSRTCTVVQSGEAWQRGV